MLDHATAKFSYRDVAGDEGNNRDRNSMEANSLDSDSERVVGRTDELLGKISRHISRLNQAVMAEEAAR